MSNISCGIFEQITGVFAKVFAVALYTVVYDHSRFFTIPNVWYWLVILFLGVDLGYYWAHRMSHQVNLFWAGHVVHHQSEEYNLSVALRQGALQKIFTAAFYLPLALLGFSPYYFLLLGAFNTLYQFWIHTEAIRSMGPLEWIMNTPSHHRVHHGRNPKYIDRNHAGVFIIWDRMFGTFQPEEEKPVYGITMPVQCWDPVSAHLRPFRNMRNDWKTIKEWRYRLQLLFMKPGWLPEKYGGYRAPKEVYTESYVKFNNPLNRPMTYYLLVQFLFILGGTSFFLFNLDSLSASGKIVATALITLSIMTTGFLFEGRKWASRAEYFRLILVWVVLKFFLTPELPQSIFLVTGILVAVSLIWVYYFNQPTSARAGLAA